VAYNSGFLCTFNTCHVQPTVPVVTENAYLTCITAWPRWTEDIVSTFNENPATLQFGQGQLALSWKPACWACRKARTRPSNWRRPRLRRAQR
jgi:hypothetical protein